jgi:hypothetical protein
MAAGARTGVETGVLKNDMVASVLLDMGYAAATVRYRAGTELRERFGMSFCRAAS